LGTLKKLNKSVSCLVNAFNNSRDCSTPEKSLAKRAASLHNLQDSQTKHQQLQREKDNFYKYKNAEQAKMQAKLRSNADEAFLNANETRPKRDDSSGLPAVKSYSMATLSADKVGKVGRGSTEDEEVVEVELRGKRERNRLEGLSLSAASAQSGGSSESLQTTTSSSTTTHNTLTSSSSTGRSGGRRKYSFKTHAGRSYHQHHHPTRRLSNMDSHGTTSGGGISMVAKVIGGFIGFSEKILHFQRFFNNKNIYF